jgi:hypothetical protein
MPTDANIPIDRLLDLARRHRAVRLAVADFVRRWVSNEMRDRAGSRVTAVNRSKLKIDRSDVDS